MILFCTKEVLLFPPSIVLLPLQKEICCTYQIVFWNVKPYFLLKTSSIYKSYHYFLLLNDNQYLLMSYLSFLPCSSPAPIATENFMKDSTSMLTGYLQYSIARSAVSEKKHLYEGTALFYPTPTLFSF